MGGVGAEGWRNSETARIPGTKEKQILSVPQWRRVGGVRGGTGTGVATPRTKAKV